MSELKQKIVYVIVHNETNRLLKPSYLSMGGLATYSTDQIEVQDYYIYGFDDEESAIRDVVLQVNDKKLKFDEFFIFTIQKITVGVLQQEFIENKFSFYLDEIDVKK